VEGAFPFVEAVFEYLFALFHLSNNFEKFGRTIQLGQLHLIFVFVCYLLGCWSIPADLIECVRNQSSVMFETILFVDEFLSIYLATCGFVYGFEQMRLKHR
jgi:Na+-driven multidrug efflux pump